MNSQTRTSNSTSIMCSEDGVWNVTSLPPCQEILCPELQQEVTLVVHTGSGNRVTSKHVFTCQNGTRNWDGHVTTTLTCLGTGEWDNPFVECAANRCIPFSVLVHASVDSVNATEGASNVMSCDDGYHFDVPDLHVIHSTCTSNLTWQIENPEAKCTAVTCPALPLSSTQTYDDDSTVFATIVQVTCLPGYITADGNDTVITECMATEEWSVNITEDTCKPVLCPEVVMEGGEASNKLHEFPVQITLYCYEGNWLADSRQFSLNTRCTELGDWQPKIQNCTEVLCPPVPVWKNVEAENISSALDVSVNYSCSEGFTFTDDANYSLTTCQQNGEWEPPFKECVSENGDNVPVVPPTEAPSATNIGTAMLIATTLLLVIIIVIDVISHIKNIIHLKDKVLDVYRNYSQFDISLT